MANRDRELSAWRRRIGFAPYPPRPEKRAPLDVEHLRRQAEAARKLMQES